MSTVETPSSLSALRDSFAQCRFGRKRAQSPIELKYQAVSLLEQYGAAELADALKKESKGSSIILTIRVAVP